MPNHDLHGIKCRAIVPNDFKSDNERFSEAGLLESGRLSGASSPMDKDPPTSAGVRALQWSRISFAYLWVGFCI